MSLHPPEAPQCAAVQGGQGGELGDDVPEHENDIMMDMIINMRMNRLKTMILNMVINDLL